MQRIINNCKKDAIDKIIYPFFVFMAIQMLMMMGLYFFTLIYMLLVFNSVIRLTSVLSTVPNISIQQRSNVSESTQENMVDQSREEQQNSFSYMSSQEEASLNSQQNQQRQNNQISSIIVDFMYRLNIAFSYYLEPSELNFMKNIFLILMSFFLLYYCISWKIYKIIALIILNILTLVGAYSPVEVLFYNFDQILMRVFTITTLVSIFLLYYLTKYWLFNNLYAVIFVLAICNFSSYFYTNQIITLTFNIFLYYILSLFLEDMTNNWITKLNFPWKFIFLYSVQGVMKKASLSVLLVGFIAVLEKTIRECLVIVLKQEQMEMRSLRQSLVPFFIIAYFIRYYVFADMRVFALILLPCGIVWALKNTVFSENFADIVAQINDNASIQSNQ